jgi:beta-lactamase class A
MDAQRWDEVRRRAAHATSRRGVLRALAAGPLFAAHGSVPVQAQIAASLAGYGDWSSVEALIREVERTGGVVGVALRTESGELFAHNGERRFRAASTIKVPIMIEAYRMSERGLLALEDRYRLHDNDRTPGSGVLAHLHSGLQLTFADLISLMIGVSDNTATNILLDRIGLAAVNTTMRSLGMRDSLLGRKILGHLPKPGDPENWATPREFAQAIDAIVSGKAASPACCTRMLETLQQQGDIRRISRFLPADPGIRWGTKPGDLPGVVNDVGFVSTDRGTLSIAVYCENLPDLDVAERAIGQIAATALSLTGIVSFVSDD